MSFLSILSTLLIGPLKLIFEIIYSLAYSMIGHPGLAIIVLSLTMNILVLPLYRRADAMQEAARETEAKLHDGVDHIRKTFSGDERMMILQTYYRQNHYSPLSALNGSVSLLLEIPFFMAAYQFLSHLGILEGVSLGPIADLSVPDGMLVIGSLTLNLLPILMTLINFISSALYLKGYPLKTKIQLYAMALFFLVFLYDSPACLVFYWTLNNLFSLVKTIFYKLKNPRKVLSWVASITGAALLVVTFTHLGALSTKMRLLLTGVGLVLQAPLLSPLMKGKVRLPSVTAEPDKKLFLLGAVFLTVLVGVLIPSNFIAASPQEYVDVSFFHDPLWYVVSAACLAAGTFLVWMQVFYWLASPKGKAVFDVLVWVLCGLTLVNYMFFGTKLGVISATLVYEKGLSFTGKEQLLNLAVMAVAAAVMVFVFSRWRKAAAPVLLTAVIALGGMSVLNLSSIHRSVNQLRVQLADREDANLNFQLSKTGKNVVVLFLDRAVGAYIPFLIDENPELAEQFDGFTYYDNTISFGGFTNFGTPAMMGGYEYTPVEMNKRDTELLVTKHNEAIRVMPAVFAEGGYEVTVSDPPYANYQWSSDLSVYNDHPEIRTFLAEGSFSEVSTKEFVIEQNRRNFFCFSIMKVLPLYLQTTMYNSGNYHQFTAKGQEEARYEGQTIESLTRASGIDPWFMRSYNVLINLPYVTNITEEAKNTFLFLGNNGTHEPMLFQRPDYVPTNEVDNSGLEYPETYTLNGNTISMGSEWTVIHYQTNMAVLKQVGKWMDYLRQNGVYDNTRIIIVSDHGQSLGQVDTLVHATENGRVDAEWYFPLLLVKDFGEKGFKTSHDFMTNADVPTLAFQDLIENPQNPYTGRPINSDEKFAHKQLAIDSFDFDTSENNGTTFLPAEWVSVQDDIWKAENWDRTEEKVVLKEHALP